MKKRANILIADHSTAFCLELQSLLCKQECYHVIGVAKTTAELLALAKLHSPDLILYDLSLPGEEAITTLRKLRIQGSVKYIMVTTDLLSAYVSHCLVNLGVSYCLLKPCPADIVVSHMAEICASFIHCASSSAPTSSKTPPLMALASELLLTIGVPANVKGYQYLLFALTAVANNPDMVIGITKVLYPQIAREFNTKTECVERNIRSAISRAHGICPKETWEQYFGRSASASCCPSNGKFIGTLARHIAVKGYRQQG